MRVLDLLQLLQDYPPNTLVHIHADATTQNIGRFLEAIDAEQPRLIIVPKTTGKPLKCWELRLLLNRPDWRQRFLYVRSAIADRSLFGLQEQTIGLILN